MKHRLVTIVATLAALLLIPTAAWAGACANLSRTANAPADTEETVQGRWVYDDFDGAGPAPAVWGFVAPGTFGTPGNFQNGDGDALLDNTAALCNENRTATHGVQNHRSHDC